MFHGGREGHPGSFLMSQYRSVAKAAIAAAVPKGGSAIPPVAPSPRGATRPKAKAKSPSVIETDVGSRFPGRNGLNCVINIIVSCPTTTPTNGARKASPFRSHSGPDMTRGSTS